MTIAPQHEDGHRRGKQSAELENQPGEVSGPVSDLIRNPSQTDSKGGGAGPHSGQDKGSEASLIPASVASGTMCARMICKGRATIIQIVKKPRK